MYFLKVTFKEQSICWDMNESIKKLEEAIEFHKLYGCYAESEIFSIGDFKYATLDELKDMPMYIIAKLLKELA